MAPRAAENSAIDALVAAGDAAYFGLVIERVHEAEIAFAGHTEKAVDAVERQCFHQYMRSARSHNFLPRDISRLIV